MSVRIFFILASVLLLAGWQLPTKAQNGDPLIYTVGKVFQTDNAPHAYILWQPGNPATTYGKEFAVYRKEGTSDSPAPYVRLGRTKLQVGPGPIQALLKLGGQFDYNAQSVSRRINTLYAESTSQDPPVTPAPAEPGMDEAKKLAYMLKIAAEDETILERISFLGRTHPGVYMSMGHGFAIKTNPGSVQTYEVRQTDAAGNDIRVIGRVTLDADNPTSLTSTSRPFEVFYVPPGLEINEEELTEEELEEELKKKVNSPRNHLVTRLRWGTPDELRRLLPHSFGFNLYRVREDVAKNQGWDQDGVQPEMTALETMVSNSLSNNNPDAKKVNSLPIMATALMTDAQAQDTDYNTDIFFAHDDNESPVNPFIDGESFYYFVAPLDIAGHPGPVSPGTKVVICDRLPPTVPVIESVRNVFEKESDEDLVQLKGNQHFRIRIRQTADEPAENAASKYYIYRWSDHTQHIREGGSPLTNRVGEVDHIPGQPYVDWDDTEDDAPIVTPDNDSQMGQTWWYTVRAADNSACSVDNLSGHSPPTFGVLRDRAGPGKAEGALTRCLFIPTTLCKNRIVEKLSDLGLPLDFDGFMLRLIRNNKLIKGADIRITRAEKTEGQEMFRTSRYFSVSDFINVPMPFPVDLLAGTKLEIRCHTLTGLIGEWEECDLSSLIPVKGTIFVYPVLLDVQKIPFPVTAEDGHPPHENNGPGGSIAGPEMNITLPDGTAEYRIYRRVGSEGSFDLIAQGYLNEEEEEPVTITLRDPAPPTAGNTEVCYFVQVLDENGNAGPRIKIGCVTIKSADLGTPMLAGPTYLNENDGQAQLRLDWFCDPVGVERFEIWAAPESSADPQLTSVLIGPKLGELSGAISGTDAEGLLFSGYQTKTIQSGQIGSGAEFSVILNVPSSKTLTFSVRAVGKGTYQDDDFSEDARSSGPFSNTIIADWSPPAPANQDIIPWPALAVPDIADIKLNVANYQRGEGPFYASALPEGSSASASILMGTLNRLERDTQKDPRSAQIDRDTDPLSLFFSFRKQNTQQINPGELESIIPFVVYRHQLPTEDNPDIVPNLVQVSPLIDRIAYKDHEGSVAVDPHREIRDPFFRFRSALGTNEGQQPYDVPVQGTFQREMDEAALGQPVKFPNTEYLKGINTLMCWVDPMPVAKGARYQYLIVHFNERGEIDRVIPTNYVDQP